MSQYKHLEATLEWKDQPVMDVEAYMANFPNLMKLVELGLASSEEILVFADSHDPEMMFELDHGVPTIIKLATSNLPFSSLISLDPQTRTEILTNPKMWISTKKETDTKTSPKKISDDPVQNEETFAKKELELAFEALKRAIQEASAIESKRNLVNRARELQQSVDAMLNSFFAPTLTPDEVVATINLLYAAARTLENPADHLSREVLHSFSSTKNMTSDLSWLRKEYTLLFLAGVFLGVLAPMTVVAPMFVTIFICSLGVLFLVASAIPIFLGHPEFKVPGKIGLFNRAAEAIIPVALCEPECKQELKSTECDSEGMKQTTRPSF